MSLRALGIDLHVAGFDLLSGIRMQLEPGTVTAVVGPNGAGKSSLLRVLSGDLPATRGEVHLNGRPLADWDPQTRARMLAVLPQQSTLDFPFTAREVVGLARIPHRTGAARDREIVQAALEAVDAGYLDKRYYTHMSGGEKQRVQLARVLAQIWEPESEGTRILLLDEPTSAFDLSHQQLTLDIVRRFAGDGVAVLAVLHDLNLAARCADRMLVLSCGVLAADGTPEQVLDEALVERVFGLRCMVMPHPITGAPMLVH